MQEEKKNAISTVEYERGQLGDIAVRLGYAAVALSLFPSPPQAFAAIPDVPTKGYQTKSGLKYFDAVVGTGIQPKYGTSISCTILHIYCFETEANSPDSSLDRPVGIFSIHYILQTEWRETGDC